MYDDNLEYAKGRLEGTVVRVGNEPVLVMGVNAVGGKIVSRVVPLDDLGNEKIVKVADLNLEPVPLGYVNHQGGAYYVTRKPMRRDWKQGLRQNNICFVGAEGFYDMPWYDIQKTILGEYPKPLDAIDQVTRGRLKSVAFSRDFSVDNQRRLNYKGRHVVGTYDKMFTLSPKYNYLNEYLQETLYG